VKSLGRELNLLGFDALVAAPVTSRKLVKAIAFNIKAFGKGQYN
jgi:hypothetical protein